MSEFLKTPFSSHHDEAVLKLKVSVFLSHVFQMSWKLVASVCDTAKITVRNYPTPSFLQSGSALSKNEQALPHTENIILL